MPTGGWRVHVRPQLTGCLQGLPWRRSSAGRANYWTESSFGHHVGLQYHDRAVAAGTLRTRVVAAGEDAIHRLLDHGTATAAVLGRRGAGAEAKLVIAVAQAHVLHVVLRRAGRIVVRAELVGGVEPAVPGQAGTGTNR